MTTQIIESTESSASLDNNDLLIFFRAGQDDEIRKSWETVRDTIIALSGSTSVSNSGTAGMYLRYDANGAIESVRGIRQIDAKDGLPQATAALEGLTAVNSRTNVQYVCVEAENYITESSATWIAIASRSDITISSDRHSVTAVVGEWVYEVSTELFYIGTTVNSRVEWIQDEASDALSASVSTSGNEIVFLHNFYQDADVKDFFLSREADTDYMYFNTRVGEFRYVSAFTPAGGLVSYYEWRPIKADERIMSVIDGRSGEHAVPSSTGVDDNRLRLTNYGLQVVRIGKLAYTAASGSFANYTDVNYYAALANDPATTALNIVYYNTTHHIWMIRTSFGEAAYWTTTAPPDRWVGTFRNEDDALSTEGLNNGDIMYTGEYVQVLSGFTAGRYYTERSWNLVGAEVSEFLDDYITDLTLSGNTLTAELRSGAETSIDLSAFMDHVESAGLTDAVLTLTRENGDTVTVDLSTLITDNHVSSAALADDILTLTRVGGETVTADLGTVNKVPAAGATGQVLSKNSETDYDAGWVNLSSSGTDGSTDYVDITGKLVASYTFGASGHTTTDTSYIDLKATAAELGANAAWDIDSSSGSSDVSSEVESTSSVLRLNLPGLRPTNDIFGYIIKSSLPNLVGEVEGAITDTGTLLTFVSAPDPVLVADDILYIGTEIVRVVSGASLSYQIARGHSGSVATGHVDGLLVYNDTYETSDEVITTWGPSSIYNNANRDLTAVVPIKMNASSGVTLLYTSSYNSDGKYITMRVGGHAQSIPGRAKISVYWAVTGVSSSLATDTSEDGTSQTGFNAWQHVLWQNASSEPIFPSVVWGDSGWSAEPAPWYRSRDDAQLVADGSSSIPDDAPVWIAYGRTTRDSSGSYTVHTWSITQEFGVEYSIDGDTNWHSTQADADEYIRFRLADGDLSGAVRIVSDLRAAAWTRLTSMQVYEGNTATPTFSVGYDISQFEELRFEVGVFVGWINGVAIGFGNSGSCVIYRPSAGWGIDTNNDTVVRNDGTSYLLTYSHSVGVFMVQLSGSLDTGVASPSTQSWIHTDGSIHDIPTALGFYCKFSRNSTDDAEYLRTFRAWNFSSAWLRTNVILSGR